MAPDKNTARTRQSEQLPEVIDSEEYGTITLVFHDSQVADNDAFDMPDGTD